MRNITVTADKPKIRSLPLRSPFLQTIDAAVKRANKDIANKVFLQGFRKGKHPRPVINSVVGYDAVLAQAANDLHSRASGI